MWHTCPGHFWRRYLTVSALSCCLLIGNSRWHWAFKKTDKWEYLHTTPDPKRIESLEMPIVAWAAVGPLPKNIYLNPAKRLTTKDIPLKELPPWLGIDRALAGWKAFKKAKSIGTNSSGLLVADAGTILSLTRISANGEFAGGQLIAGLRLQLSAMANGAKNLQNPGTSSFPPDQFPIATAEAMQRGSLQALIGTLIEATHETNMPLWLCGGDAPILIEELKKRNAQVRHYPNLVLEGMVEIQQQIKQDQDL